jgi:hypothetical protein
MPVKDLRLGKATAGVFVQQGRQTIYRGECITMRADRVQEIHRYPVWNVELEHPSTSLD